MICERAASLVLACLAAAAVGCISREPGATVAIEAVSSGANASRTELTSDRGYEVELAGLYLVLGRIELVRCPGEPHLDSSLLHELFGRSVAHAHGVSSPTAWTVPNVLSPIIDRDPVTLAVLHPPATQYCSVRLSLEAADDAAEHLPPEVDMLGLSMYIAGTYATAASDGRALFRYQSPNSTTAELALLDSAGRPAVLSLTEDNLRVTLRVELAYTHMLDGFVLLPGAFPVFSEIVLASVFEHVTITLVDDAG